MKRKISVVVPIFNEQEVLPELIARLKKTASGEAAYDFEFIMVENGSEDSSYDILQKARNDDARIKIVRLSRNFGCDGGITAGLNFVRSDACVIMNADLQDPPELIPAFLRQWESGHDVVYGVIKARHGEGLVRKACSSLFYVIINALTRGLFPKNVSDFRLISRKVVDAVNSLKETNRYMRGLVVWTGFRQTGVEFERPARFAGRSKSPFRAIVRVAANGIFSFSYLPLRLTTFLGIFIAIVSFCFMVIFVTLFFICGREVPGHTSTITIMLFLFGILFFILGIIGEYLARIYDEVKDRPNFIVSETQGID
ncbi:MAG: glycosyltransferase family 2 protein [Candidatus Omnitrophica bacterium]|nr:glycosyltransferase family 2 protein [Candidatus Omnitrophota bacterium]